MAKKRILRFLKWFTGILLGVVFLISGLLYIYRDEICQIFINELNAHLKAKVKVESVDVTFWGSFPNLSVDFNKVFVQDAFPSATDTDTLLYSDRVRLKFNPLDIWRENYEVKSIDVSPGTLQLKVNAEGEVNYDIVKPTNDSTKSEGFDLNLQSIHFTDFAVSYNNQATNQIYRTHLKEMEIAGALSTNVFTAAAASELTILEARSGEVALVKNQPAKLNLKISVDQDKGTVHFPKSTIYVAHLPFSFNGDVLPDAYDFHVEAQDIKIDDAANHLSVQETEKIKRFEGTGKLLFALDVDGQISTTEPAVVDCSFGIKSGTLRDPSSGIRLRDIHLDGKYSNRGGSTKEFLSLKNVAFQSPAGPFSGQVVLTRFDQPRLEGKANGSLDLSIIHALFASNSFEKLRGTVDVRTDFLANTILDETNGNSRLFVDRCEGSLNLHDVIVQLKDDQRVFEQLNGAIYLRNQEAGLEHISLRINHSDMAIDGVFQRVSDFIAGQGNLQASVSVKSKRIDISDLASVSKEVKVEESQTRTFVLPENIDGDLYLEVSELNYEAHNFRKVSGDMTVNKRLIHFPRVALTNAGADIKGSLTIEERSPEYFYISSQLASKNIDLKSLFKAWNNFEQEVITPENISGRAQANVIFEAPFHLRGGIVMSGIKSTIGLQIDNGQLRNVGAFKSITQSLRETPSARAAIGKENINTFERKLLDLTFERLTNTLVISDGILTIPTMSIASSALDVELTGRHGFDNKIDYRFGFRFRDLKAPETSEFGNIIDDNTGLRVFLRMYGTMDNPIIEWDKQSRKVEAQQQREAAKQDAKSILKTEFGLFKNDTTVKQYVQPKVKREEIILEYNPVDDIDDILEESTPKKKERKKIQLIEDIKKSAEGTKPKEEIDFF